MNGIDFTCSGLSNLIDFPGIWGDWQTAMLHCDGGFSGTMVKFEQQVDLFSNLYNNGCILDSFLVMLFLPWLLKAKLFVVTFIGKIAIDITT